MPFSLAQATTQQPRAITKAKQINFSTPHYTGQLWSNRAMASKIHILLMCKRDSKSEPRACSTYYFHTKFIFHINTAETFRFELGTIHNIHILYSSIGQTLYETSRHSPRKARVASQLRADSTVYFLLHIVNTIVCILELRVCHNYTYCLLFTHWMKWSGVPCSHQIARKGLSDGWGVRTWFASRRGGLFVRRPSSALDAKNPQPQRFARFTRFVCWVCSSIKSIFIVYRVR